MKKAMKSTKVNTAHRSIVKPIAWYENVDNGFVFVDVQYQHQSGELRVCRLPRSDLLDPRKVQRLLFDWGAIIDTDIDVAGKLIKAAADTPVVITGRTTRKCGWHDNQFVLPMKTLGRGLPLQYDARLDERNSGRGLKAGDADAWLKGLKEPLRRSSYLTFAASLAFAAPIVAASEIEETAVFHMHGESNTGKTLCLKLVVSVLGRARETDLISFNATRLAVEDTMDHWSGTVLALNEMKTGETSRRELHAYAVQLAHVLTSGRGKTRSETARAKDPTLNLKQWKAFAITNKEQSLEKMAKDAGVNRDPGERARLIDLPVPPRSEGGIFDLLDEKDHDVAAASRRLANRVERTIADHYGHQFPKYIAYLAEHRSAVKARFVELANGFLRDNAPDENWERRYACKFAYAYAGGVIAVEAGVLPCTSSQVQKAVSILYQRSRASFRSLAEQKSEVMAKLKAAPNDTERFPLVKKGQRAPKNYDSRCFGFQRRFPQTGHCLAIRREVLLSWAGSRTTCDAILGDLKAAGAHVPGKDKAGLTQIRKIKGGKRRRYVMLRVKKLLAMN